MRWKLGNGRNISICKQPWLRDKSNPKVNTLATAEIQHLRVFDLMLPQVNALNHQLINTIFQDRYAQQIRSIPLLDIQRVKMESFWAWAGTCFIHYVMPIDCWWRICGRLAEYLEDWSSYKGNIIHVGSSQRLLAYKIQLTREGGKLLSIVPSLWAKGGGRHTHSCQNHDFTNPLTPSELIVSKIEKGVESCDNHRIVRVCNFNYDFAVKIAAKSQLSKTQCIWFFCV